jgi:hypothetical protein
MVERWHEMSRRIARENRRHEQHLDECGACGENLMLRVRISELFTYLKEVFDDQLVVVDAEFFSELIDEAYCDDCFIERIATRLRELNFHVYKRFPK